MTAQITNRDAHERADYLQEQLKVKSGAQIFVGSAVGVDATGAMVRLAAGVTATALGVSADEVLGDGIKVARYKAGAFEFTNGTAGDALTDADRGATVYAADDQTAAKLATGSRPVLGKLYSITTSGRCVVLVGVAF